MFASIAVSIKSVLKKITPVRDSRLENFQVQLKSTSEAFEFTQKSNIICRVTFLQNHFTYQLLVSVQISEVFPGSYYHFPWLSPQIQLDPPAKEKLLQILIDYFFTLALTQCVYKKSFSLALFPEVLFSVFRLLLLWATSHGNPCNISIPIERNRGCHGFLAQKGDMLDGFFPSFFSTSLHPTLLLNANCCITSGQNPFAEHWAEGDCQDFFQ